MRLVGTLLLTLIIFPLILHTQDEGKGGRALLGSNAEGTRFMIGFMQNEVAGQCAPGNGQRLVSIASRFQTNVRVTLPNGTSWLRPLKPGEVYQFEVDRQFECFGEGVFRKGVEIVATEPVSVYCYNGIQATADGYLALPVNSWGTQYVAPCYAVDYYPGDPTDPRNTCYISPRGGELAVIAAEDSTIVSVYPAATTVYGIARGRNYTKVLFKGDIFQVQDGGSVAGLSDLTGSVVVANKPFGLLSGHVRASIPALYPTKDHLIEMIPPRNTLGKRYFLVPYGGRQGGDLVRVIAGNTGLTQITLTLSTGGTQTYTLADVGEFIDINLTQLSVVTATQSVLVAQYSKSAGNDPRNFNVGPGGRYAVPFDPYMIIVTPEEQFVNAAVFQTMPNISSSPAYYNGGLYPNPKQQYDRHFLTVVGERDSFASILLNDQTLASQPGYTGGFIPNTPYAWATVEVADGKIHRLEAEALFGGYVYGLGQVDSYGWPVGAGLRKFDVPDVNPPHLSARKICGKWEVITTEPGPLESGLKEVWLDTSWSQNVIFEKVLIIRGDEYSLGTLRVVDPLQPGRGRVIAEDLAGNRDTIELAISSDLVVFDRDSIYIRGAELGKLYRNTVRITNPNTDTMLLADAVLALRKGFLLSGTYKDVKIPPGGYVDVDVLFGTDLVGNQRDTITLTINCIEWRIPLLATMGLPGIATEDLDFGTLRKGRTTCIEMHVFSTGDSPLRLDSVRIVAGNFAITRSLDTVIVLPPGTDTTILVCFTPDSVGDFDGHVTFFGNADSSATGRLIGKGIYPSLETGGYDFGRLQVGDTLCQPIPIINTGSDTAHVTGLALDDSTAFRFDKSIFPRDLAPGDTMWVDICFTPGSEARFFSGFLIRNGDGLESGDSVVGRGYRLRASINGYDWHERRVGSVNDTVVFVRNLSSSDIDVTSVWISGGDIGDFSVVPLPGVATVPAGDSLPISVSFLPLLTGDRSCYIFAATSSRETPEISAVLQGFALQPMASDVLSFNGDPLYSCGTRTGSLTIYNEGNMPLTIDSLVLNAMPPQTVSASVGYDGMVILPGDSVVVTFNVHPDGAPAPITGEFVWSFDELPGPFTETFKLDQTSPQVYGITLATPTTVGIGSGFDLMVAIDSVGWKNEVERELTLRIEYNPTVVRFNLARWSQRFDSMATNPAAVWKPVGTPVFDGLGAILLQFRASPPSSLDSGMTFVPLPFDGFIGNSLRDTFVVTMKPSRSECALEAVASAPYSVDSICMLTFRLIEFTGSPFALRQNTPNPASGRATIEYVVGLDGETHIDLFDGQGMLVRRLVNGLVRAGEYRIEVDVKDLPSGEYFYRMESGPFGMVRRMVITQ